ncbi:hypothetical protein AB0B50_19715 [Streptomyces sp. NPDC041068]|uniref:hypothetical protein n=1 Tax=Streptomyces sp. NPDC041068 TaxID=3155130 RepID=UPI0033F47E42
MSNHAMSAEIGLPVSRALVAYVREDYRSVVDLLLPIRRRLSSFGGSHAQRDALQKTLVEAALRAGAHDIAGALLGERLSLRPSSTYNLLGRARLATQLGDDEGAAAARRTAREYAAAATPLL